jgi:L-lactate dehydrogenase complex protein LldG
MTGVNGVNGAREEILERVRRSLGSPRPPVAAVSRSYRREGAKVDIDRFIERLADYRAEVVRCAESGVEAAVAAFLAGRPRAVAPEGLRWPVPATVAIGKPTTQELEDVDAVVTGATLAIEETGTIVLTHGPGEGRRAMTLVPDLHVCIVGAVQVVSDVPAAFARLDPARPTTWISGPSATSDIELQRVEGVHGPRNLRVVVVDH